MKKNNEERLVDSYSGKSRGLFGDFLGVKARQQKSLSKSIPGYKTALFCKALTEVVKDYDVRVTFDTSYGNVVSPTYRHLQISREEKEELLVSGIMLAYKDSSPLVIQTYPGWGTMELNIMYRQEDSSKIEALVKAINTYMVDNNFYKGEKIDALGRFLPIPDIDFDDVVLPEDTKKKIKMGALDFFSKKEIYNKAGIDFKRGLIMTGVPGTGKTMLAKVLLANTESTFIWVNSDTVSGASDIKRLFTQAKELSPVIMVLEDMDDALESQSVRDALKTNLDGLSGLNEGIVTIICTNHPDRLPMSLLRPGRFDEVIILNLPDESARLKIMDKISVPMDIENKDDILKDLASKTKGFTPAQLKEVLIYSLLLSADAGREMIIADDIAKSLIKIKETQQIIAEELRDMDVKSFISEIKKNRS